MRPHQLSDADGLDIGLLQVGTLPNSLSSPVRVPCEPSISGSVLHTHQQTHTQQR